MSPRPPRTRPAALAALAATAAATVALFLVSRGRWSDPLIDSGREWIVPDTLARGGLLYRDVVYWFGPFTPYFQALFLRVFGSGFAGLVVAGAVTAAGALAALHAVLTRVASRRDAALWTALAIPALVFMPNAGGALLGMGYRIWQAAAFTLAAVALASSPRARRGGALELSAGACAGLAGLCRTEWGLAAAAAAGLACLIRARATPRAAIGGALRVAAGWFMVFGIGLSAFLLAAGPAAVVRDGHVLLTGLPEETRHFLVAFSGVRDFGHGAAELVYSAAMWTGIFLLAALAARPRGRGLAALLRALAAMLAVLAVLAAAALAGGAGGAVLFSAAPLVSLLGLVCGARRRGPRAAALAACGFLGLLLSYRRPFHIGDSAYVAPPLLFAFVCAAGILRLLLARERPGGARARLARSWRIAVAALVAAAFVGRAIQYRAVEGVPIPGTDGMLTARAERSRSLEELAAAIRARTRPGEELIVFPEGELLNLLARRGNPIRHKLYLPGYLTAANEDDVVAELEASRPGAIVVWLRPTGEYDRGYFGRDYGRRVAAWIADHYAAAPFGSGPSRPRASPTFTLYLPRERPLGTAPAVAP